MEKLIRKYKLAGRIRFLSFSLLLLFLLLMKFIGGYSYLNVVFISLIFVEAILNQPYNFILRKVNIHRFQYYQMATDIIAISWVLHYMGGMEAPLVTIAYYAVILWAGVVSTTGAVFFAVTASALLFSSIVILGHFGILPFISYYDYKMPTAQMFSLLAGNVSFLFAFGYFSAHASKVIQFLQRKRQEESLQNVHKLVATGSLVGNTAHDVLNYLGAIKGYVKILLKRTKEDTEENKMLKSIEGLESKSADSLSMLSRFSKKPKEEFKLTDIIEVIEDALKLTWPLTKYANITIKKEHEPGIPQIMADKEQLHECFVALILNALDAMGKEGTFTIKIRYIAGIKTVEILFSDTGTGIKPQNLDRIQEPFFTTKGEGKALGLGLTIVYEIIARHNGKIDVKSTPRKGTTFVIKLPVKRTG